MPFWIPRKYQEQVFDFAINLPAAGLLLPPGLGKTSISLKIINHFKEKTLIIAPLRVMYSVWPREIEKWDNFRNIKYTILHGPDKLRNFRRKDVGVYLINPEGLKWLIQTIEREKRFPFVNLFIDESSKFKAHKSKRFKFLAPYLKLFKRRYILTGTPIPNTYLDLWAQIYILDFGRALGKNFYQYRNRYFYPADFRGWSWKLRDNAEGEIQNAIKPFVMHLSLEDIDEFDMPELVVNDIEFDLPPEVQKAYKTMEKHAFAQVENGEKILAPSAASAVMKCAQICNGFMYESLDEEEKLIGKVPRIFQYHNIKVDIAKELVEELQGSPLLIAYWFKEDYRKLREAFPDAAHIGSGVSGEQGAKIEKEWNEGKIPILLASLGSVSHGLNLQEGPGYSIMFYCLTYDFDTYDQLIRRILRQGARHKKVVVHRPIAKGTVDRLMCDVVEEKDRTQSAFLNAVKHYIQKL